MSCVEWYLYLHLHCYCLSWCVIWCTALNHACEKSNETITSVYSAVTLNTNSKLTSVSLKTLVSEISSMILTVSSLCICTLNSNNLKLKIRSLSEYFLSCLVLDLVLFCLWFSLVLSEIQSCSVWNLVLFSLTQSYSSSWFSFILSDSVLFKSLY